MKQKQHSIYIICFSSLVIIMSSLYCYYSLSLPTGVFKKRSFIPIPDIQAPSNRDMKTVKQLENKLPGIAYPVVIDKSPINMQIFGISSYSHTSNKSTNKKSVIKDTSPGYSLTFTLKAGRKGICTINNNIYKVGDLLPDGSSIQKVESNRVSIQKNNSNRWLYIVNKQVITQ